MIKIAQVGVVNIANVGTRVQLSSSQFCTPCVVITANHGNTNNVFIGTSAVTTSDYFVCLAAGQSWNFVGTSAGGQGEDVDITCLYADTQTNNNKVHVGYYKR